MLSAAEQSVQQWVSIDFVGGQRLHTRTRALRMPIDGTTRVTDALAYVRARFPALALPQNQLLITVNAQMATTDQVLRADDTIAFLPPLAGG